MARQKKPETPRNEDGIALKKDGTINLASQRGKELVKSGTFLQKKVADAVQEAKKIPETIDEEDDDESSDEDEAEFEISNVAERKEIDQVVEEKISKKLEFIKDTETETKKFLEEEKKAREDERKEKEELKLEKEKILKEKEILKKERDDLLKSLEPVHKDFQTLLNENRQLKKLKQQNNHLDKLASMSRKYIVL